MIDIKMLDEFPSLKHQYEQMIALGLFKFFLPKNKKKEFKKIKEDFEELVTEMVQYSKNFSDNGWIAYDSLSVDMMKKANAIYKEEGYDKAEKYIVEYYTTEVKMTVNWLYNASQEFMIRKELIEDGINKHFLKDYKSSVLIFLTVADGIINDYTKNKGFFTENVDLSCWDCLVGCSKGLKRIKDIYNSPRKTTNSEEIFFPYRNGILHGRDLNYGNELVSSKCLVMLFAIRDWIMNKNSESARREKYDKEINPPSLKESIKKLSKIKEDRKKVSDYKPININIDKDIPANGNKEEYKEYPYIYCVVEMLEYWKNKNYGGLAKKLDLLFQYEKNENIRPRECRKLFEKNFLKNFRIVSVKDQGICMKIIQIYIEIEKNNIMTNGFLKFGIIYEGDDVLALPQNENGEWKIYPQDVRILY